nr:cell division protein FtsQ/DivIB [Rhodovulum imhoffii]
MKRKHAPGAPSRWAYRAERLWLTPVVRNGLRFGVPVLVLGGLAAFYLGDPANRAVLLNAGLELRRSIVERPEFMVSSVSIVGASPEVAEDIGDVMGLDFPVSSFDLDLDPVRQAVTGLDAIARADLFIRPGGVLEVRVVERTPRILWRSENGLELLDREGHRVGAVTRRGARADLPLIVGQGAEVAVPEALALLAAARPVEARLRGLVRMGERRWDVVLDRGQRILLPEEGALAALERVMALDQAEDLLSRDVVAVDLRIPARPTLRMGPNAQKIFQEIKAMELGATSG